MPDTKLTIDYRRADPVTGAVNTFQEEIHRDIITRYLVGEAGVGTGKTYALWMKGIRLSILNRGVPGGLLVPDYAMFRRDVKVVAAEIGAANGVEFRYNGADHCYEYPWGGRLWILSAERPFPGVNLGWGLVNEYSLVRKDQLLEFLNRRIRVRCPYPQALLSGTPEDRYGYIQDLTDDWTGKKDRHGRPLARLVTGGSQLNAHNLLPDYMDVARATLDPMAFKLWMGGERVRINTDAFYYAYDEKKAHRSLARRDHELVHACLDFNVGNMHAVLAHVIGHGPGKFVEAFGEIVLKNQASDTAALCRAIRAWNGGGTDGILVTCDASGRARKTTGPSDVEAIRAEGFQVRYKSYNPYMRERQLRANGLLANGRLKLDKEKCPVLHRDLLRCQQEKVTLEKKRDSKGEYSHASDALDYLLDFEFPDLALQGRTKFREGRIYGEF